MTMLKRCTIASLGSFIVGIGVAFNQRAGLGNDPVGIFYDGLRVLFRLSDNQLGTVTFIFNLILIGLLLMIGKRYISIGTVVYFVFYGISVQLGGAFYELLVVRQSLWIQIIMSTIGCLSLYIGVAFFIAADIGYDPMTGSAWLVTDTLKWPFGRGKILFDCVLLAAGVLMGGKLGVITVITALSAGPVIQKLAAVIKKRSK